MAGAGYKLFNTGDVLTAAQVNTYLQEQVTMVFANSTARTTALSGVLAEGMMSYLADTDLIQYYNGTSWVTVNTDQTPLTTKGDLFTYSTADARLAVGSNGDTLLADSAATTGLRWQASQAAGKNGVINGGMDIWQRGTSFTAGTVYTADRWMKGGASNYTLSRQSSGLTNFNYCARIQRNNGATTTNTTDFAQAIETEESLRFAGKAVVLSFWARAGANYSSASSALAVRLIGGTGTDQTVFAGYTGSADQINTSVTLTTSWQRFSVTGTVTSTITELSPYFSFVPVGTAGANDYFEITGVQLELGSVPTTFTRAGGTLAGELAACQRYYQLIASGLDKFLSPASAYSASQLDMMLTFPEMRVSPSLVVTTGTDYYRFARNGGTDGFNSITLNAYTTTRGAALYNNTEISSTAGHAGWVYLSNASASVALSSEL